MKSILILSPHMDDAVLSLSSFIQNNSQNKITVLTIFNIVSSKRISKDCNSYIKKSGFKNAHSFQKARNLEDTKALKKLNVENKYLNYFDAGFRNENDTLLYPSHNSIFFRKVNKADKKTINSLSKRLFILKEKYDLVLIPIGIGNHIDHIITKKIAERIFDKNKQIMYIDLPYAFKRLNILYMLFAVVFSKYKKIIFSNNEKKELIKIYNSQFKILFPRFYFLPFELLTSKTPISL